jgi:hypothetical protein
MTEFLVAMLILAAEPVAQTDRALPEADEVFACGFEEATDKNFDRWPDEWTRRRGRGYPVYLPVEIVADEPPSSGNHCLQIRLDGGAAQLYSPHIPIVPQFSYQLTAKVRTRGLKYDIVSCAVAFYDGEEKLLEMHESPAIRDAARWTQVNIGPVTPVGDRVRTAVVSIHVRPTEQVDLSGEIYIDDLWLGRLPKLSVQINGENGLFTDPADVRVNCRVSGFKNARPKITFELLDIHGTTLHKHDETLNAESESRGIRAPRTPADDSQQGFAGSTGWQPPVTAAGFYTVRASTPSHSGQLMTEEVNFVVIPPLPRSSSGEFGWSLADGERQLPIRMLPSFLSQVGVHWVKFPVWFSGREVKRAEDLAWFAERLSSFDIELVGLLDQPPTEVRDFFGVADQMPIATAFTDKAVWHPALDPVMTRLSLKVRWWQLGRDDDTSFASYPDLGEKLREIRDDLANFGQRVNVGVPWRAIEEHSIPSSMSWAFLSYIEDLPFTDEELKSYVSADPKDQVHRWVMLQPLSALEYDLETRARDLVRRMLAAKIAEVDGIFVPEPFDSERGLMQANSSPGPLLLVWRTAATLVGGRSYGGNIKLPEGSENHLFFGDDDAVMVVWNDRPVIEKIHLGDNVRQYDIWGHQSTPQSTNQDDASSQEIRVGPMPTFVTGINPALAKWRRDFRFETERLASIFGREQPVAYHFTNSFPQGIGGRIKFIYPSDWKVSGSERQFKLGPGESLSDKLGIQLGADSTSGMQPIQVDFDITADRKYKFRLYESIQVGLGDVVVQLETRLDDAGNLIVDQHLTNNTDKNVSFKCYLTAPGRRRERQQVFDVGRGRTTNTYVLANGRELLGKTIWLRAEEIEGARVLNDHVLAHE